MVIKRRLSLFFLVAPFMAGCQIDAPCDMDELYNDEGSCVKCHQYFDSSGNGYHLNDEGKCSIDTENACGEGKFDCQTLSFVSETHCYQGSCVIDKCTDGYIVANNKCYPDVDTDFDGTKDPFDPCPKNPTKWHEKWWNKDKTEGIRCDFRDTDRDGVDDFEDDCETNPNIHELQQANGCLLPENKARCCGLEEIKFEDGETHTYYHIYNAMDLYNLYKENKLVPQATYDFQYENGKCIDGKFWTCLGEGWCVIMTCESCENDEEGNGICHGDYGHDNKFDVILENDINLDDIYNLKNSIGTTFKKSKCSFLSWNTFGTMAGANFDGNNHKIYYRRINYNNPEESIRCSLPNALFKTINGSFIHDLSIDFDMRGLGRALFTETLDSSIFNNINLSGILEYSGNEQMIGSLVGNLDSNYHLDSYFNNIYLKNVTVTACSDYVGGVIGSSNYIYARSNELIKLESVSVSGRNYVGGVVGNGYFQFNIVESNVDSVSGNKYVGGFCGDCRNESIAETESLINQVKEVFGKDSGIGGFAGNWRGVITQKLLVNRVEKISGNSYVGGFIGNSDNFKVLSDKSMITVYNFTKSIVGKGSDVGGFIGESNAFYLDDDFEIKNVYNHIVYLESNDDYFVPGGFISTCNDSFEIKNVWNAVDLIISKSGAGGFIGELAGRSFGDSGVSVNIHDVVNYVGNVQSTCDDSCKSIGGFISEFNNKDGHIVSTQISNVYSEVDGIKNHVESCGFMCNVYNSEFDHIHSQIHEISGETVSGFASSVTENAKFHNVSSFAVLNTCDSPNNGLISTPITIHEDSSFAMSNVVAATFSKANANIDYQCETVLSRSELKNNDNVYYYAPNNNYLSGNENNNIESFTEDDSVKIALDSMGSDTNLSSFNYGETTVTLPAAITLKTLEDKMGKPDPKILEQYDFETE